MHKRKGGQMNATIKLEKQRVFDCQNFLQLMYSLNVNFMNYQEFWSIGKIAHKLAKLAYSANWKNQKIYTLKLTPDETQAFVLLIGLSENLLLQSPYYNAMFLDICGTLNKHALEMEHKKNIYNSQQDIKIPKLLNDEQSRN